MKCKTCDYRLWNLRSSNCPECGWPFVPSDFEFVINSVQFCCPHCDQAYYGTGEKGHLVPEQFTCVRCATQIHMNQMTLRPTHLVSEEQTEVDTNPWLIGNKKGWLKAWFFTFGRSIGSPLGLMRATPENSTTPLAVAYLVVTSVLFCLLGAIPWVLFALVMSFSAGGAIGAGIAGFFAAYYAIILTGMMGFVALWGIVIHGLLRLTGQTEAGPGRTYQAICYSCAPNLFAAIPCVSLYFFWIGWIWWAISAIFMICEGQRVRALRATFAVLCLPTIFFLATGGLFAYGYVYTFIPMQANLQATMATMSTLQMNSAVTLYYHMHNQQMPGHAAQLVISNQVVVGQFIHPATATLESNVPIGLTTLDKFALQPTAQMQATVTAAAAALGPKVIAHRVGDYVFTYHGIKPLQHDPKLWIVILWPDPVANPGTPGTPATPGTSPIDPIEVGLADGGVDQIPLASFTQDLAAQNTLRAAAGLAPLPDPATITHAQPATGP